MGGNYLRACMSYPPWLCTVIDSRKKCLDMDKK